MLHSLVAHNPGVEIDLLHEPAVAPDAAAAVARMVEEGGGRIALQAVPDELVRGLRPLASGSTAPWYAILAPELLPDHERVLFVDGDAIVCDSLGELWGTELAGKHLGAVTNVLQRHDFQHAVDLGLPGPADYFNSGVLLMDLAAMRRDGVPDALRREAVERAEWMSWRDQDALNAVLWRTRLPLHPRWNCMNSFFLFPWADEFLDPAELDEARSRPGIRHFEGPGANKPWHEGCERPGRELYLEHRRGTPWPEVELERDTPGSGLLARLRRAR